MRIAPKSRPVAGMISFALLAAVATARGQDSLTLDQALKLAKERNGNVRAAYFDVKAAQSRTQVSYASFFPVITPTYTYVSDRQQARTGGAGPRFIQTEGGTTVVAGSWRLLDSGEREYAFLATRRSEQAQVQNSRQTLRNILFSVDQQFFNALRAQALEKVAGAEVGRTQLIVEQTQARVNVGSTPRKDVLQAQADALNATVVQLQQHNSVSVTQSVLKSTIGWDPGSSLPPLQDFAEPTNVAPLPPLLELENEAVQTRPDLVALRFGIEALRLNQRLLERQAGLTFGVDLNFDETVTPRALQSRALSFTASYPLFDAGRSREAAREVGFNVQANLQNLLQTERTARSDIESAYAVVSQDLEVVRAARLAQDAAQLNYTAAVEAQRAGAAGTSIITVSTAQVSLVTAQSNYIQAIYDYYIADAALKLATGQRMPGE